jgi:alpha-methylacyl-CoA racemase
VLNHQGPLSGLKIVELAGIGPGPYCGMLLADLGAEVIQIDRPGGATAQYGIDATKDILNRGKRSVILDLKDPNGLQTALALIAKADALIESNRPGVAEKLGLGPDVCLARNPRLVYGRITGWGQTGPMAKWAGHDIDYIALSGALYACGNGDHPPAIPGNFVGDMGGGGIFVAFGITSALIHAQRTGKGQVVDAAMIEGAASQMAGMMTMKAIGRYDDRRGTHMSDGGSHFYNVYTCKDGKYVAVGCIEPQFYASFRKGAALTDPEFDAQMDAARWPSLKQKVASRIAEKTRDEWMRIFDSEACVAPILAPSEVEHHPHMAERQAYIRIDDVLQPAPGPKFSLTPGAVARAPVNRGADTEAVLKEWGIAKP